MSNCLPCFNRMCLCKTATFLMMLPLFLTKRWACELIVKMGISARVRDGGITMDIFKALFS